MQTLTYLALNPFWPSSVCKPYWYLWNTTLTYLNLKYSNVTLDHPLTFNEKPQPNCIDSFCILNHVLKPGPSTYLPLLLSMFVVMLLYLIVVLLFIVVYCYCLDSMESYELRWKECVSNDKFQKASDAHFINFLSILICIVVYFF